MGLFSLTQELAIDLGTANTLIIHNGKVVVDEPSIVALDVHTGKLVAIGTQARQMHEKTNPNIKTARHDQESQDFGQSLRSLDPHGDLHSFRLDQCRDPCRAGFRRTCRGA